MLYSDILLFIFISTTYIIIFSIYLRSKFFFGLLGLPFASLIRISERLLYLQRWCCTMIAMMNQDTKQLWAYVTFALYSVATRSELEPHNTHKVVPPLEDDRGLYTYSFWTRCRFYLWVFHVIKLTKLFIEHSLTDCVSQHPFSF
jgi:hypothetical protein